MALYGDYTSITPLPDYIRVYAEYKEEDDQEHLGESRFTRIYFVGIVDRISGDPTIYPAFLEFDDDGWVYEPSDRSNFVKYHFVGKDTWISKLPEPDAKGGT